MGEAGSARLDPARPAWASPASSGLPAEPASRAWPRGGRGAHRAQPRVAWGWSAPPERRGCPGEPRALPTRPFVRTSVPQEELPEPFEHLLQRIARRPKPQQFFGLMGKRDAGEMGSRPSLCLSGEPAGSARSFSGTQSLPALSTGISSLKGCKAPGRDSSYHTQLPEEGGRQPFLVTHSVRPQPPRTGTNLSSFD